MLIINNTLCNTGTKNDKESIGCGVAVLYIHDTFLHVEISQGLLRSSSYYIHFIDNL